MFFSIFKNPNNKNCKNSYYLLLYTVYNTNWMFCVTVHTSNIENLLSQFKEIFQRYPIIKHRDHSSQPKLFEWENLLKGWCCVAPPVTLRNLDSKLFLSAAHHRLPLDAPTTLLSPHALFPLQMWILPNPLSSVLHGGTCLCASVRVWMQVLCLCTCLHEWKAVCFPSGLSVCSTIKLTPTAFH